MRLSVLLVCLGLLSGCAQILGIGQDDDDDQPDAMDVFIADARVNDDPDAMLLPDAAPGTLGLSATDGFVRRGGAVQLTIMVSRGTGVSGPVTITVTGLPAGVTAAPLSISGDSGQLSISASAAAALGPVSGAMIHAAAGAASADTALTLTVDPQSGGPARDFGTDGAVDIAGASGVEDLAAFADRIVLVQGTEPQTLEWVLSAAGSLMIDGQQLFASNVTSEVTGAGTIAIATGYVEAGSNDVCEVAAIDATGGLATTWGTAGELTFCRPDAVTESLGAVSMGGTLVASWGIDDLGAVGVKLDNGVKTGSFTNLGGTQARPLDGTVVGTRVVLVGRNGSSTPYVRSFVPGATTSSDLSPADFGCEGRFVATLDATHFAVVVDCGNETRLWRMNLSGTRDVDVALAELGSDAPASMKGDEGGTLYVQHRDGSVFAYGSDGTLVTSFGPSGDGKVAAGAGETGKGLEVVDDGLLILTTSATGARLVKVTR